MATHRNDRKPYSRPATRPRGTDGEWLHDKAPSVPTSPANGPRNRPVQASNTKLLVSNLHYELTPKELIQIFGQMGTLVREPLIRYDRSGRSSGVAIISYENADEAARALKKFDGLLCKGQPMSIEFDAGPPPRPQARRVVSAPSLINRIQKPPLLDRLSKNQPQPRAKAAPSSGPGPIRNKPRVAARQPKKPKTAEELDMELDAYLKDDSALAPVASAQNEATGDVEMSS